MSEAKKLGFFPDSKAILLTISNPQSCSRFTVKHPDRFVYGGGRVSATTRGGDPPGGSNFRLSTKFACRRILTRIIPDISSDLCSISVSADFHRIQFVKPFTMQTASFIFLTSIVSTVVGRPHDDDGSVEVDSDSNVEGQPKMLIPLPSKYAIEQIGVKFLDALIKKGQMEMAKGAFKTQLEVLEKVHPEQYEKYKKIKIDDLAADAVMQQAEIAKLQPKTGNPMVDMLNENGIPIASSLRGIEQAIKTQKEMETQDPSELIAKAVLEKFQTQILPGLVANIIAGRNPFKIPQQMRQAQAEPAEIRRMALQSYDRIPEPESEDDLVTPRRSAPVHFNGGQLSDDSRRSLVNRLRNSPRLRSLLENPEVMSMLSSKKLRDQPLHGRALAFDGDDVVTERRQPQLDPKSALVLGLNEMFGNDDEDDDDENEMANSIRRSPLSISSPFVASLKSHPEVKAALEKIKYRVNDVEKYLMPKPLIKNPNPQPGFFVPRKLPTRPRKMLPLVVGIDENEESEIRRMEVDRPLVSSNQKSRVLRNLKNNPNIAPLFMDGNLEEILTGREILTPEQKGKKPVKQIKAYPRLFGMKTYHPIDSKISQIIEERPVPPMMWTPKGRHTRLRWVGATEKEIPGIGTRFVLPSLDPTMPAVSAAYSTQGRARDEWDTMFKIPNTWKAGDDVGFKVKTKSQRFIGGNGGFEMPAAHQ